MGVIALASLPAVVIAWAVSLPSKNLLLSWW